MKYLDVKLVRSAIGELKESDACSICGEKHFSNNLTIDHKNVCDACFNKDIDKEIVPHKR